MRHQRGNRVTEISAPGFARFGAKCQKSQERDRFAMISPWLKSTFLFVILGLDPRTHGREGLRYHGTQRIPAK